MTAGNTSAFAGYNMKGFFENFLICKETEESVDDSSYFTIKFLVAVVSCSLCI